MSVSALRFVGIDEEDVPTEQGFLMTEESGVVVHAKSSAARRVAATFGLLLLGAAAVAFGQGSKHSVESPKKVVQLQEDYGGEIVGQYPASAYPAPGPQPQAADTGMVPAPAPAVPAAQVAAAAPMQGPGVPAAPAAGFPATAPAQPAVAPQEVPPVAPAAPGECSAPGDDCRATNCCDADKGGAGMTCFEKDATWASCQDHCDTEEGWSCAELGEKTKSSAGCTWAGDDCSETALCCNRGFMCVKKDEDFTGCTQTKKETTWVTAEVPIPDGWDGTIVGPGRDEYEVGPAGAGDEVAGTSLYCFMAFLPGSYEEGLKDYAKQEKASIYACDAYDVFHTWDSGAVAWDTGETTISNTDVFVNVWEQVGTSMKYAMNDWTVKVDPDALLLPERLKSHIQALAPPAYQPIYLKNNVMDAGMGNNGFLGAVEVFSKQAVMIYIDNAEGCHKSMGTDGGEDGYFKGCMDALGVGFMTDGELFFPDKSAGACNNEGRAAFHPLKTVDDWSCCWDITNGIPHNVEYGTCTDPS